MTSREERIEHTTGALQTLAERGRQWAPLNQIALEALRRERAHRRDQRSRLMNSFMDMLSLDGMPRKAGFVARNRTMVVLDQLESDGLARHRFVAGAGMEGIEYRLVPQEGAASIQVEAPVDTARPPGFRTAGPLDGYGPQVM